MASVNAPDFERIDRLAAEGRIEAAECAARALAERLPRNRRTWWRLGRLLQEHGNDVAAWRAFKRCHRLGHEGEGATGLLDILVSRGRLRSALELARRLAGKEAKSARLLGLMAKTALAARDVSFCRRALDEARAANADTPLLRIMAEGLDTLQCEQQSGDSMQGLRHIAIAGFAHTGSTVMGIILGSVPGFAFAGEAHNLVEVKLRHHGGSGKVAISEDIPVSRWPVACRVCKRDCAVFSPDFRLALAKNRVSPYAAIARRLGTTNLVTADKTPALYMRYDPLCRFDMLVLYKSPVQQMRSELKVIRYYEKVNNEIELYQSIKVNLNYWTNNYLNQLYLIKNNGPKIFSQWERFVADPRTHMEKLARALDIPVHPRILDTIRLGHFNGGNTSVDVNELRETGKLTLRSSNAPDLPPALEQIVRTHKRANYVHRLLEKRYRAMFG